MLVSTALFLGSCSLHGAPSTPAPLEKVALAPIPPRLKKHCADPILVEEKADYSIDELLIGWQGDAQHLDTCGKRLVALVNALEARDAAQGATEETKP